MDKILGRVGNHNGQEKLQKPDRTGQRSETIVMEQRRFFIAIIAETFVAKIQDHTPAEIGGQPPPE